MFFNKYLQRQNLTANLTANKRKQTNKKKANVILVNIARGGVFTRMTSRKRRFYEKYSLCASHRCNCTSSKLSINKSDISKNCHGNVANDEEHG